MQVSTNPKAKQQLKLTATEASRLQQAEQVAKGVSGGALMLSDMKLREVADKALAALATLQMYLSDKRPVEEAEKK